MINYDAPVFGSWTVLRETSRMGRTSRVLLCPCGSETTVYVWSFHGCSHKRCAGCTRPMVTGGNVLDDPLPKKVALRHPFRDHAGFYRASRSGDGPRHGWVVIYRAAEAGIDVSKGDAWAVSCETHSTFVSARNTRSACDAMKNPAEWCEECRASEANPTTTTSKPTEIEWVVVSGESGNGAR